MAQVIKIKRSNTTAVPSSLAQGELAYSSDSNKFFIGNPGSGDVTVIGGKLYIDMLDHTAGVVTASSALVVDSNSKIDLLNVDNITIDGNSIVSTDVNGDLSIAPDGSGNLILDGLNWPQADGTADQYLKTNGSGQLSWENIPSGQFTVEGTLDTDTETFTTGNNTLKFTGTGPVTSAITASTNQVEVTFTVDDATTTTKGIASFDDTFFSVTSGVVTSSKPAAIYDAAGTPTLRTGITSGQIQSLINVDPAGTDNSTDVTLAAGGKTYVTLNAGQELVIGAVDLSTDVTGTLPISALSANSVTIGTDTIGLGATQTDLNGLTSLDVDNLALDGNTISSTDTDGDITLSPNGTGVVDVSSSRITGVAEPVNSSDAATKGYVDAVAEGLHVHEAVHAYVDTPLATITGGAVTYDNGTAGVGATLTLAVALDLAGGDLDGDTDITTGDRVIIAGEATAAHNGIYVVTSTTVLTRAEDFDSATEMAGGDFVFVTHGTQYADTGWVLGEPVETLGTDPVDFIQFSGAGVFTAGDGLDLTGTEFSVNVAANGGIEISSDNLQLKSSLGGTGLTYTNGVLDVDSSQTQVTALGTITTGVWNGTTIGTQYGGSGLTTYATGDILYASSANTLAKLGKPTVDDSSLRMSSAGVPSWSNEVDGGTY